MAKVDRRAGPEEAILDGSVERLRSRAEPGPAVPAREKTVEPVVLPAIFTRTGWPI